MTLISNIITLYRTPHNKAYCSQIPNLHKPRIIELNKALKKTGASWKFKMKSNSATARTFRIYQQPIG